MSCEHTVFEANAEINRHVEVEGGPVVGYSVDLTVTCVGCGQPFCFRGLPYGLSMMEPRMTVDSHTAHLPIHPVEDPLSGIGLPGFDVVVHP